MELSKRQKEIIGAAISLIAQNGIEGLTTKALAAAVGISEPALYRHFSPSEWRRPGGSTCRSGWSGPPGWDP